MTEFQKAVLGAVTKLGGRATEFEVAEKTGMTWSSVRSVMRRMGRTGILDVVEVSGGRSSCGGGPGSMLVATLRAASPGSGPIGE